jgi:mono/diheme cytochrome c family protein
MKTIAAVSIVFLSLAAGLFAADATAGHAAYDKSCKGCHGATGSPNPAIAKMLSATIPELGSAEVQKLSDADLVKVVNEGKGKMKPMKGLSASPEDVIAFVRTLKK